MQYRYTEVACLNRSSHVMTVNPTITTTHSMSSTTTILISFASIIKTTRWRHEHTLALSLSFALSHEHTHIGAQRTHKFAWRTPAATPRMSLSGFVNTQYSFTIYSVLSLDFRLVVETIFIRTVVVTDSTSKSREQSFSQVTTAHCDVLCRFVKWFFVNFVVILKRPVRIDN